MSGSVLFLAEFSLAVLFHAISAVRISLILKANAFSGRISLFFLALLINWLAAASFLLPYEIYGAAVWRPQKDVLYEGRLLFWIAMPAHVLLAAIPVSLFFLTIDRICIIRLGTAYSQRLKLLLRQAYFFALVCCLIVNLSAFLSALPVPQKSECEIFGCILSSSVQYYLGWRAFCAVFNTASGVVFAVLLFRSRKQILEANVSTLSSASQDHFRRVNRANNILTGFAILSEMFLSFLPHFGPLVWEKIFGAGSSLGTGPLSEVMSSIEVLLFSAMYSHVLSIGSEVVPSNQQLVHVQPNAQKVQPHQRAVDLKWNRIRPFQHQNPGGKRSSIVPPSNRPHTAVVVSSGTRLARNC